MDLYAQCFIVQIFIPLMSKQKILAMTIAAFLGLYELIGITILSLGLVFLPIVILIDIIRNDFNGNDKLIWALLVILIPLLGSLLYLFSGMNQRIRKE